MIPSAAKCFVSLTLAALAGICVTGCVSVNKSLSALDRNAIYARAGRYFTNAVLLKPHESVAATNPAFALAPLILQEVADTNADVATGPREVFYESDTVLLNGSIHKRMTYVWALSSLAADRQGIRITLNSSGLPVIWEVLNDHTGARIIFVSRSLELAAAQAAGKALPGRRFAVEKNPTDAPEVVVARVIEDGPVAMGPIVHLSAETSDVTTLICRCMTTQARQIVATGNYELRPLSEAQAIAGRARLKFDPQPRVDQCLRLPPRF
jgi:hypothetical protein